MNDQESKHKPNKADQKERFKEVLSTKGVTK